MHRRLLIAAALLVLPVTPRAAWAQDALVVTTDALRPGLADWLAHRRGQGLVVAVTAPGDDVAATIRDVCAGSAGRLRHVLLLGDVGDVPCAYRDAIAIDRWEDDTRIATDAPYADVDGDEIPDLAIGRVPATDAAEARAILARSIAYETRPPAGPWRRRLTLVEGEGGFGAKQDATLEMLVRLVHDQDVPAGVETRVTYAKETSPFCLPPPRLQDSVIDDLAAGSLVLGFVGHGAAHHLDRMRRDGEEWPILEQPAAARVRCRAGAPLVVFVACSTGRYDGRTDCLAEALLRVPDGPAAVIASSRVSTPYGNGLLAIELLHGLFGEGTGTAGEALLRAKRAILDPATAGTSRRTVESLAGAFYEPDAEKRARDRLEHVYLYQLLGDPLLRVARPAAARLFPPAALVPGTTAEIAVRSPVAGRVTLELAPRLELAARPLPAGRTADEMTADHARANASPVASVTGEVAADSVGVLRLEVPEDVGAGRHVLRAWIEGADGCARAGVDVRVVPAR